MKFSLKAKLLPIYDRLKNAINEYHLNLKNKESLKEKAKEEYEDSLKGIDILKEKQKEILKEKEELQNKKKKKKNTVEESIEEVKLKNELAELKETNKLEIYKLKFEKDIEKKQLECLGNIEYWEKEGKMTQDAKKHNIEYQILQLKYECLKDEIYNDKGFDELIDIAKKRKDEIINDELENFKEQKKQLEKFKINSEKRIENIKAKNDCEIQKKFLELQNYKYNEYNNFLIEKEKRFKELKTKFSGKKTSSENFKNIEIKKAKMFYDQQKEYLQNQEQAFQMQKQNINAFIKQLEINDDDYSKYLLSLIK